MVPEQEGPGKESKKELLKEVNLYLKHLIITEKYQGL